MGGTRFIIAATPRSGSNWLVSALNSHPAVVCAGELLDDPYLADHPSFAADPWAGLERFWRDATAAATGFKLFAFHCWDAHQEHRRVWDQLKDDGDLRVLFLTRINLLALAVSWARARQTGEWKVADARPRRRLEPLHMDPDGLLRTFERLEQGMARMTAHFAHHRQLHLTYESLFDDPDARLAEVQGVLGVPPQTLRSPLQRQASGPLHESIANLDDVRRAFAGTTYSRWLEAHAGSEATWQ